MQIADSRGKTLNRIISINTTRDLFARLHIPGAFLFARFSPDCTELQVNSLNHEEDKHLWETRVGTISRSLTVFSAVKIQASRSPF
jgi:hypothetical protein